MMMASARTLRRRPWARAESLDLATHITRTRLAAPGSDAQLNALVARLHAQLLPRDRPLWQFLAEMSPQQIVDLVDFRHISDALSPDEALDLLTARVDGRAARPSMPPSAQAGGQDGGPDDGPSPSPGPPPAP
jgi:hypothetical protein